MDSTLASIDLLARTRLLELECLYRPLVEIRVQDRDDDDDTLIVTREDEIARVLGIIESCARLLRREED